ALHRLLGRENSQSVTIATGKDHAYESAGESQAGDDVGGQRPLRAPDRGWDDKTKTSFAIKPLLICASRLYAKCIRAVGEQRVMHFASEITVRYPVRIGALQTMAKPDFFRRRQIESSEVNIK